jgi:hypothetical protein
LVRRSNDQEIDLEMINSQKFTKQTKDEKGKTKIFTLSFSILFVTEPGNKISHFSYVKLSCNKKHLKKISNKSKR